MYTIKIMSSKDFDSLPMSVTRGSDISDSLGFADPVTNTAYVRHTSWPELNSYLIDHEFEHLIEDHKTDMDANGLCHKKGGFFRNVMTFMDPLNTMGTRGGAPFAGTGDTLKAGAQGALNGAIVGGPVGATIGGIGNMTQQSMSQGVGAGGSIPKAGYQGEYQTPGFSGGIPYSNQASYGQGFGQQGAPTPSGQGYTGANQLGLFQPGLAQGGITMAGNPNNQSSMMNSMFGGQNGMMNQDQSGYFRPLNIR